MHVTPPTSLQSWPTADAFFASHKHRIIQISISVFSFNSGACLLSEAQVLKKWVLVFIRKAQKTLWGEGKHTCYSGKAARS